MDILNALLTPLEEHPGLLILAQLALLVAAIGTASVLTRVLLLRGIGRILRASPTQWDDALLGRGVIARLANVVPALVAYYGIVLVDGLPEVAVIVMRSVASAYVVLTLALAVSQALNAINDVYVQRNPDRAAVRPIKGYIQLLKLVIAIIAGILIIASLFDRDPLVLLSGLGAMTAVLLLVFKDTLLSLVASVQLSNNDMLRVGDWIEIPDLMADGDVVDISLHTVKVQNWDKTITTIPTWKLIDGSFKNWRGMFESGGRRIKRALYLDQGSVRFLTDDERQELCRFALIDGYLERKQAELEDYNRMLLAGGKDPVNTRRVTNLGTFRAYVEAYVKAHPGINTEMTNMVRQLAPGPSGIPLELYCFTKSTEWAVHEAVQADIFDHLLAILPEFGLRVFQQPAGTDVTAAAEALAPARSQTA
ncbi:MAG: mechanosensitive ion channel family protein [Gammaproteobacteria bacterium]|jgi:miniconductance mechanosensitive channel|nr:mechanosensitive ion channel family protein [Gammaproteobacteria bacterium]